jgi:hypothetical protein
MDVLQFPFTSAALLLAIAGVQKWRDPGPVSGALRLAHLPHGTVSVRAFATVELVVAFVALTVHHEIAALSLAALYTGFASFVVWALARGLPIESCGCFGRADARPSPGHVVLDATLAATAVLVAIDDVEPVRRLLAHDAARGSLVIVVSIALAALATAWLRGAFTSSGNRATHSYPHRR